MYEQISLLEDILYRILITRSWKSLLCKLSVFRMEVKAPDANILALQYLWPDNTSNISRASSVTSEIRKVAKRVNASSHWYEIPLPHEATEITYGVIHEPMHKEP